LLSRFSLNASAFCWILFSNSRFRSEWFMDGFEKI